MSAIPAVPVTIRFVDTQGQGIPGASVKAALTSQERYQGQDVPGQVLGLTDAQGEAVLALFPNELGSEGSAYALTVTDPYGGSFVRFVAIPNSPCNVELGAHVTTAVTGPQGQTGQKGEKGDKGDKGDQGERGLQGIQGVQGAKGDKGDTGAKGDRGEQGPAGDMSKARRLAIIFG
ncbi:Phage tail fiber protein [Desulfovibrio sp. DV]|uniref:collagen-like protein n=1 Tax=Desulfovibrio sp. DV TaxID=1844708 RepID=UPI00094BA1C7|nr:collagen-like protein [Desulfovibrio sp. DV]OLN24853.1 Phage tail fiber protein [Desulfovibrio sp. DV]